MTGKTKRLKGLVAGCLLLLGGLGTSAFGQRFVVLGDIFGGSDASEAFDVSADGTVVVGVSDSINGWEAFRWTEADGMEPLGDLPGGDFESWAFGVSADGSVVVGRGTRSRHEAFRWTRSLRMRGLGSLSFQYPESAAFDVSADGTVIVGSSAYDLPYYTTNIAFRWTATTGMQPLGSLNPTQPWSSAYAISADGSVVAGMTASPGTYQAFRWTTETGMQGIGWLSGVPNGETRRSAALGISQDGSVIVGFSTSTAGFQAFRWTQASGMVGLGDLPGGDYWSEAYDVSGDGALVVGSSITGAWPWGEAKWEAFIWDAQHGMRKLQDVLANEYGLSADLQGWVLTSANAITPDGKIIVGGGVAPDESRRAWLVDLRRSQLGDINGDGCVDDADLLQVLFAFGNNGSGLPEDVNGDGVVDDADLLTVLFNFGNGC